VSGWKSNALLLINGLPHRFTSVIAFYSKATQTETKELAWRHKQLYRHRKLKTSSKGLQNRTTQSCLSSFRVILKYAIGSDGSVSLAAKGLEST
jgi:hypothetical protein